MIYPVIQNQPSTKNEDKTLQNIPQDVELPPESPKLGKKTMKAWTEDSSDEDEFYPITDKEDRELLKQYTAKDER